MITFAYAGVNELSDAYCRGVHLDNELLVNAEKFGCKSTPKDGKESPLNRKCKEEVKRK